MAEKPREAYKAACAELAELLVPRGFAASRQNQQFDRVEGDVVQQLSVQLLTRSIAGERVVMVPWALAGSQRVAALHAERAVPVGHREGWLGGGMLAHVTDPRDPMTDFNVATPAHRKAALHHVARLYEAKAVPFWNQFQDADALARRLRTERPPTLDDRMVEWLLVHDRRDDALACGRLILDQGGAGVKREYDAALTAFRMGGVPSPLPAQTYGTTLAARAVLFDMTF